MYFKMWCVFFELVETENKIPGIVKICCTSKEQFPFDFWILWIITNMAARVLLLSNKFVFVCHWIRLWRNVTSKSFSFQMSQSESHFELAYQRGEFENQPSPYIIKHCLFILSKTALLGWHLTFTKKGERSIINCNVLELFGLTGN